MVSFGVGPVFNKKTTSNASLYSKDPLRKSATQSSLYYNGNPASMERSNTMGGMPQQMNPLKVQNPQNPQAQQPNHIPSMIPGGKPIIDMNMIKTDKPTSGKKAGGPFIVENPGHLQPAAPLIQQDKGSVQKPKPMNSLLASPVATSALKVASTEPGSALAQSQSRSWKPSEIQTASLRIGTQRFTNQKIFTKIHFGKKQFVWELSETQSPMKGDADDPKMSSKKKFEVRFADIEKIDVNTETHTITIEAKEKPKEYKEHNPQPKKTTQWIKDSSMTDDMYSNDENGTTQIVATFGKDVLTKTITGKQSHLDKIKGCELPLTINGTKIVSGGSTPFRSNSVNPVTESSAIPTLPTIQSLPLPMPLLPSASSTSNNATLQINIKKDDLPPYSVDAMLDLPIGSGKNMPMNGTKGGGSSYFPGELYNPAVEEPMMEEEDDEESEFPLLTKDRKADIKKFEGHLKNMKPDDKIDMVLEVIKPKRYEAGPIATRKVYRCPVDKCNISVQNSNLLKKHFQKAHKKLIDLGLDVDQVGNFQWKPELLDFCLMISKIYPKFVKNVIKETKRSK